MLTQHISPKTEEKLCAVWSTALIDYWTSMVLGCDYISFVCIVFTYGLRERAPIKAILLTHNADAELSALPFSLSDFMLR